MINNDELNYKMDTIIKYLKENGGYEYKVCNHLCPDMSEPDSNIVEYSEDVYKMINLLIEPRKDHDIDDIF